MIWQLYAIISAISVGCGGIITKYVVKVENYIAYSWFYCLISSILFLLFLSEGIMIPTSLYVWGIALFVAGLLWTIITLLGIKSTQLMPLSLKVPLSRMDVIFLLIFSVLILQEVITTTKVIGTVFIFIGLIILTWQERKFFGRINDKGVRMTLLAAFLTGIVSVVDKATVVFFLPAFYSFLEYLLVPLYLMPFVVKEKANVKKIILNKKSLIPTLVGAALSTIGYYSRLSAYMLTEASNVFPITQLSTIISVMGGFLFFKEGELRKRIVGSIIMIIGSIMILKPEIFSFIIK